MTAANARNCPACQLLFALTRRQNHPGLLAPRMFCGHCRPTRVREQTAARNRSWRKRHRDAESALSHAGPPLEALRAHLGASQRTTRGGTR